MQERNKMGNMQTVGMQNKGTGFFKKCIAIGMGGKERGKEVESHRLEQI